MLRILLVILILLQHSDGIAAAAPQEEHARGYTLGSGDMIKIHVYGERDLSVETMLGDQGVINYPYLGEIQLSGLTVTEAEALIHNGLKEDILLHPNVHISIVQYRPFFIHGEVNKPGAYPFQPNLTVNQAIALAGGLTERASTNKIFLQTGRGQQLKTAKVGLATRIHSGDTLTIKQGFF